MVVSPVQRITMVRLDNLGDHVLGAGLLCALRATHPEVQLSIVVPELISGLYANCPLNIAVHTVPDRAVYMRNENEFNKAIEPLMAKAQGQWILNPRFAEDYYLAGLISRALGEAGARIVGFRQVQSPYSGYDPNVHYTELVEARDDLHASRYAGLMASHLGLAGAAEPAVWFASREVEAARARYQFDDQGFIALGLGASFPFKRPALDTYKFVVERIALQFRRRVILTGALSDRAMADAIVNGAPSETKIDSTVGELNLSELAALLSCAELYIGPDSGPMHMAAAAGTAVIELGWVPEDYPVTSRGNGTAGQCWSPWSSRAISIRPDAAPFSQRSLNSEYWQRPISLLPTDKIESALVAMLGGR